jgi:hypothetical protein
MTKRILVLLPFLAVALVFAGCGPEGSGGNVKKAPDPFASLDNDVMAEGIANGYISTVVGDRGAIPTHNVRPAQDGDLAQSRQVLLSHASQMRAMEGHLGVSTLVPRRDANLDIRYDPTQVKAKAEADGLIALTNGNVTAYIREVEVNGLTRTAVVGADGSVSLSGEETLPKVVEAPGGVQGVILADGSLVQVER